MNIELYLAFILATAVLIVVPGPNVILIVANSLAYGPRRALLTVTGTQCAQAIQLAVVALGPDYRASRDALSWPSFCSRSTHSRTRCHAMAL